MDAYKILAPIGRNNEVMPATIFCYSLSTYIAVQLHWDDLTLSCAADAGHCHSQRARKQWPRPSTRVCTIFVPWCIEKATKWLDREAVTSVPYCKGGEWWSAYPNKHHPVVHIDEALARWPNIHHPTVRSATAILHLPSDVHLCFWSSWTDLCGRSTTTRLTNPLFINRWNLKKIRWPCPCPDWKIYLYRLCF